MMTQDPPVFDVALANFESAVIQRSNTTPVLLAFFIPGEKACDSLEATLVRMSQESRGAFVVGRCDGAANPDLAQAFRIQEVPTTVLIKDGVPLDAFAGAPAAAKIEEFLAAHLGPLTKPDDTVERAAALEETGDLAGARTLLETALESPGAEGCLRIALARVLCAQGHSTEAAVQLEALTPEEAQSPAARSVFARIGLGQGASDLDDLRAALAAEPKNIEKRLEYGKALVAGGQCAEGLEELLGVCISDLHHDDDAPRKALIDVFRALGPADPLTLEYQQRLSVLLCS